MKFEIEVISEEILPAVRSLIAREMREDYGLTQEGIARKTGMTQAAVSNYLNNSRADKETAEKIEEDPQIQVLLENAAALAAKDQDYSKEISRIISNIRDKGILKEKFEDTNKII
ncbi:MAG: putative transcriptional regulator [Candidatus Nanosalina sp. J07AB43]|nr:MAG: putative transcriptional regulator [Candidatus Nanosalina sp. J07AB43]